MKLESVFFSVKSAIEFGKYFNVLGFDTNLERVNDHDGAAKAVVDMHGTGAEKMKIDAIIARNNMRGHITKADQTKRDDIVSKLDLVSRDEFEVLKKIVQKQDSIIKKLLKNKKTKKVKRS